MDIDEGELASLRTSLQDPIALDAAASASQAERARSPAGWFHSASVIITTSLIIMVAVAFWNAPFAIHSILPRDTGKRGQDNSRLVANQIQATAQPELKFLEAVSEEDTGSAVANASLRMLRDGIHCPTVAFNAVARDHGYSNLLPTSWGACALVGSGQLLKNAGLGAFIDLHTTVVRVNRVTTPQFEKDLGRRATMYFKNTMADYNGTHVFVRYMGGHSDEGWWCQIAGGGNSCPFDNALWEGTLKKGYWNVGVPTAFPIGHQAPIFNLFQHNMKVLGKHHFDDPLEQQYYWAMPSAGFKALLTALMVCDTVTMFGFGGAGTVDNHHMGEHDFAAEHQFEARLIRGEVSMEDFPSDLYGSYTKEFGAFRNRIICMSKQKLIAGTHR